MMSKKFDLNEKNKVVVMLIQALWGAISPNFRMIALSFAEPVWQLLFVLECDIAEDRQEIEDVAGEFDALLLGLGGGTLKYEIKTVVSTEPLSILDPSSWQIVFRRREE